MENYISKVIEDSSESEKIYCKFLSPNDSGETGGHQSGFLVSPHFVFFKTHIKCPFTNFITGQSPQSSGISITKIAFLMYLFLR